MNGLTFRLHLLEPVLATQAETGEENSAIGASYIPGSALRGAFAALYLRRYPTVDLAADPRARRLFFDHAVRFLNGYPWRGNSRLLPKPMSWFVEKDEFDRDSGSIYDFAIEDDDLLPRKPKPPEDHFCHIFPAQEEIDAEEDDSYSSGQEKTGSALLYSPAIHLSVHISLEDANYRGEPNNVYRYEALEEGEVLACAVISENVEDLELLHDLLEHDTLRIGRAHNAGYGRVRITDAEIEPNWQEYSLGDDPKDGRVVVTLLSDTILRGRNGQVNDDLDGALASALKMDRLKAERSFRCLGLVGGFNRKWGLPLVQSRALKAGSVSVYSADAVDPLSLLEISEQGIGERCSEGFGRFAVNWHTWPRIQCTKAEEQYQPAVVLSESSKAIARRMAQRRLRLLLDRKLAETVNKLNLSAFQPQNAQLSRVRNAAQESLAKGSLEPVTGLLDSLRIGRTGREQLMKARAGGVPLLDWIEARAKNRDVETELLESDSLPDVAEERSELTEEIKIEYTARFIDGIMKKAIRQNQNENRSQERKQGKERRKAV